MKSVFRRAVARVLEWQVRRLIRRHAPKIVVVAGSVGKTSTKLAVATVLKQKFRTLVHEGNYNSEIGLPLSVFRLEAPLALLNPFAWLWRFLQAEGEIWGRYPYNVLVLELGTDRPGEITRYTRYLKPDIGVITAVSPEHMANFSGLDAVAAEELALAPACRQVVVAHDQVPERYQNKHLGERIKPVYYSLSSKSGYGLKAKESNPLSGTICDITKDGKPVLKSVSLPLYGSHVLRSAVAAYAVGEIMGLSKVLLEAGLEAIKPTSGRMQVLPGLNGSTIIDDTYNSSPSSAIAALEALATAPAKGRRIAILGSMNELGMGSPRYHQEVGAAAAGVDLLITVGANAIKYLGPAAVKAGLDPTRLKPADSPYLAGDYLKLMLQPGDVVLLKGSQNGI
jgi:UDP-N-acetylmuramoyl-tripeptide--D-alanyl-D-alanine ligase